MQITTFKITNFKFIKKKNFNSNSKKLRQNNVSKATVSINVTAFPNAGQI